MAQMPQFPLGAVLFPSMVLPLHIFELRYRKLVVDVLEQNSEFGVVLIERGSEVERNGQRSNFGTSAKIVKAEQFSDGRWSLLAVGCERFQVDKWLEDDPYPQAEITRLPEVSTEVKVQSSEFSAVVTKFCRFMALASEAGLNVGSVPDCSFDPEIGTYQMAGLAPLNLLDKQAILTAPDMSKRLDILGKCFDEGIETITFRLTNAPNSYKK